jgi:Ca-activated chloride channel family protein
MSELHWSRPELWPFLLLAPLLWLGLWRVMRAAARGRLAYGAPLRERVPSPAERATLWTAAGALLWVAWMEPLLGEEKVAVERRGLDVVFCLDTSRSMLARDLEPDRLGRAKRDIQTVLPHLLGGDRVALIAFAGKSRLVVPLTHDLDSFRYLLEQVDTDTVRTGGTDLAAAIRQGIEISAEDQASTTAIVLLTDGEDLTGAGRQAAGEAAARGIAVHAVGYGSTRGSKIILEKEGAESFLESKEGEEVVSALDSEGLRAIAGATGGEFVRADVMALPLVELKRKRIDPMLERTYEAGEETMYKTRFQWALLPALILLIVEVQRHGGRRR